MHFILPVVAGLALYISIQDFKTHTITDNSNALLLGLVFAGTLFSFYQEQDLLGFLKTWLIGLSVFLAMYLLALLSRGALGGGDIKFAPSLSVGLAFYEPILGVLLLFWAFQLAGLAALVLVVFKKNSLKQRIAFAPFLTLAFYGVWLGNLVLA